MPDTSTTNATHTNPQGTKQRKERPLPTPNLWATPIQARKCDCGSTPAERQATNPKQLPTSDPTFSVWSCGEYISGRYRRITAVCRICAPYRLPSHISLSLDTGVNLQVKGCRTFETPEWLYLLFANREEYNRAKDMAAYLTHLYSQAPPHPFLDGT